MTFVNLENIRNGFDNFKNKKPFSYAVIDNFFVEEVANQLAKDFPNYNSEVYNGLYFNQLEIKKTCNVWDRFPSETYRAIQYLNSKEFVNEIEILTGQDNLKVDMGLHGGGWHIHPPAGKLNVHLDYNIHPKLALQRKFNLLIYLNPNWQSGWGGELGLWTNKDLKPAELATAIEPKFNRAIVFDTTQDSWHGLEVPNNFPEGEDRKSIALYYLIDPPANTSTRNRALFAPSDEQKNNQTVLDLISRRSKTTGDDPVQWDRI